MPNDSSPLIQNSKFNNFLWVCWFLCKNLSNFVPPTWKLHNPYWHNQHHACINARQLFAIGACKIKVLICICRSEFTLCSMRWLITLNLYIFITVFINWQITFYLVEIFLCVFFNWLPVVFDMGLSLCNFPSGIWELVVVLSGVAIFFHFHSTCFHKIFIKWKLKKHLTGK